MIARALDPAYVAKLLRYEPDTGRLFWRERDAGRSQQALTNWNRHKAGKEAFTAICPAGYLVGFIDAQGLRAHRVAWAIHYGAWPADQIDHINRIKTDNRIINLRAADAATNGRNRGMLRSNTSGVTGVIRWRSKWRAQIWVSGQNICLGHFGSFDEAVRERRMAERLHGFTETHGLAPQAIGAAR